MLAMFCFCSFKLSNSFLPSYPILFCQAKYFCKGGAKAPPKNAYVHEITEVKDYSRNVSINLQVFTRSLVLCMSSIVNTLMSIKLFPSMVHPFGGELQR